MSLYLYRRHNMNGYGGSLRWGGCVNMRTCECEEQFWEEMGRTPLLPTQLQTALLTLQPETIASKFMLRHLLHFLWIYFIGPSHIHTLLVFSRS
jgi:hypothetical protein